MIPYGLSIQTKTWECHIWTDQHLYHLNYWKRDLVSPGFSFHMEMSLWDASTWIFLFYVYKLVFWCNGRGPFFFFFFFCGLDLFVNLFLANYSCFTHVLYIGVISWPKTIPVYTWFVSFCAYKNDDIPKFDILKMRLSGVLIVVTPP